jgi:hypothetical protein
MKSKMLPLFVLLALSYLPAADHQWVLKQSTLAYHVSHPLHQTEGVSRAARGKFPMVTVRTRLPEAASASTTIKADIEIQFAGQTARYQQVAFELVTQGDERRITGTIPATLTDFKIDPPSLLTMPVKNDIPIHVEMTWSPQ